MKRKIFYCYVFALCIVVTFPALECLGQSDSYDRYAIVIGNEHYVAPYNNVFNTLKDADSMTSALTSLGFQVTEGKDLSQDLIKVYLDSFYTLIKKSQQAVVLFYFSGHGLEYMGQNYLAPVDLNQQRREKKIRLPDFLNVSDFLDKLDGNEKIKLKIVILDACRDDPTAQKTLGSAFSSSIGPSYGTYIAYATSYGQTSGCGKPEDSNCPYTKSLVQNIRTKGIKIEDLFKTVREGMFRVSVNQIPWEESCMIGDFYFVKTLVSTSLNSVANKSVTNSNLNSKDSIPNNFSSPKNSTTSTSQTDSNTKEKRSNDSDNRGKSLSPPPPIKN